MQVFHIEHEACDSHSLEGVPVGLVLKLLL